MVRGASVDGLESHVIHWTNGKADSASGVQRKMGAQELNRQGESVGI